MNYTPNTQRLYAALVDAQLSASGRVHRCFYRTPSWFPDDAESSASVLFTFSPRRPHYPYMEAEVPEAVTPTGLYGPTDGGSITSV